MQTRLRHIWLGSCAGLLAGAAGTLLVAWYLPSSSGSSPTTVFPSAVCDVAPLGEPTVADPERYTIRFVAYGDVDSDDDVPCGMISDARIAVIHEKSFEWVLDDWWAAVGGNELGIRQRIPPGVRVPSTADKLSAVPAQFITIVTTGPDGTAELPNLAYDPESPDYSFCVISPVDNLIAGCIHDFSLRNPTKPGAHVTAYIYLTHGHATIEMRSSDRYQRLLDDAVSASSPTTVIFEATRTDDFEPTRPSADKIMVVIGDSHINAWWTAISENGTDLESGRSFVSPEVLAYEWVQVVVTGRDGLAEMALTPGDYLICALTWTNRAECVYENLTDGRHKFQVDYWDGGNDFNIRRE